MGQVRPPLSPATKAQYENIVKRLSGIWRKEAAIVDSDVDVFSHPLEFSKWFCEAANKSRWAKATYWLYRISMMRHFEENGPNEASEMISQTLPPEGKPAKKNTSAKKLKELSGDKLSQLLAKLEMRQESLPDSEEDVSARQVGRFDHFIARWLRATIRAGLRPTEWQYASFDEKTNTLTVQNAKVSKTRGNGKYRHLLFDPVTQADDIRDIQLFLDELVIRIHQPNFPILYDKCRKRLRYVAKQIWPKMQVWPSIYSARHQFAANMKKSGLTKQEVAALMGHKSDASAGRHYARRSKGEVVKPPASPQNEVESVLQKDTTFKPKNEK